MHYSVMLTFSLFDRKCLFWASLVQKFKIVSLSRNLVFDVLLFVFNIVIQRHMLELFKNGQIKLNMLK